MATMHRVLVTVVPCVYACVAAARPVQTATAKKGGLLSAMRQLADGHWVLAFSSADKASLAVTLVQQHATRLQGLYGDALAPMCGVLQQQEQQQQQGGLQGPGLREPQQGPQQVQESLDPAPPEAGQRDGGGIAAAVDGRTVQDVAEAVGHLSLTGSATEQQLS